MTEQTQTQNSEGQGNQSEGGSAQADDQKREEGFWKIFEERTEKVVKGVLEKERKANPPAAGTRRTQARQTLPGLIADIVFGPEKNDG